MDLVRADYGYSDEYILAKSLMWLENASELITRRNYDRSVLQANLISQAVANIFADRNSQSPLKSYDELVVGQRKTESGFVQPTDWAGNHDDTFDSGSLDFLNKAPKRPPKEYKR